MMRAVAILILIGFMAAPAAAQGRGRGKEKVPPGHMPQAGECRVWYDGVPPGRQPSPTSCAEAQRIAARDGARVIYGTDSRRGRDDDRWERDDERRGRVGTNDDRRTRDNREPRGRAVPRTGQYPGTTRIPDDRRRNRRGENVTSTAAYQRGFDDGRVKGREDAGDRDSYDPDRHSWYRSANRGYHTAYGSKEEYADLYREGFQRGYEEAYRTNQGANRNRTWWPF
jgi:hypothetical protein